MKKRVASNKTVKATALDTVRAAEAVTVTVRVAVVVTAAVTVKILSSGECLKAMQVTRDVSSAVEAEQQE